MFKTENLDGAPDEDLDQKLNPFKGLYEHVENLDDDIYECEEIRLCNMTKQITDDVTGARQKLIYSREIPTKSMEI